jgi:hypothetical protein
MDGGSRCVPGYCGQTEVLMTNEHTNLGIGRVNEQARRFNSAGEKIN